MLCDHPFTKDNLDQYLKELAKEFRKRNGTKTPAEIILIGGASVVINYGFREMTYDMDAVIEAASVMKDAINYVGDMFNLPNGWLNADFMKTASYTPKISRYAKYYRTFSNIVTFRTITEEYLIAMKLMSGRQYKYDLSDIIGILLEQSKKGEPISFDQVKNAVINLYGSYEKLSVNSRTFIENAMREENYEQLYERAKQMEMENKDILLQFNTDYPDMINADNVNDILASIRKKKEAENQ